MRGQKKENEESIPEVENETRKKWLISKVKTDTTIYLF